MQSRPVDLLVRIGAAPAPGEPHPVEALIDGDALFYGGSLRLSPADLLPLAMDWEGYGRALADALLCDPIRRAFERARTRADERPGACLRLRLQIDPEASALQAIRWERLVLTEAGIPRPAAIALDTPVSRYTALEEPAPPALVERPVRMLLALANPAGLETWGLTPVDVAAETRALWEAVRPMVASRTLSLWVLPGHGGLPGELTAELTGEGCEIIDGATGLDTLSDRMRGFHLVHLLAHGLHRPGRGGAPGESRLLLEAADGSPTLVSDTEIMARWAAAVPLPRLVYLAACESAARASEDIHPTVGLGPKLVAAGVPAVVAMQDQVPMALNTAMTRRFYEALMRHGVVDLALNEARWLLHDARSADWSIPVLTMRLEDGVLLRPDPLRSALESMAAWGEDPRATAEPLLAMEVTRAPGDADPTALGRLERADEAGYDLIPTAVGLLLAEPAPDPAPEPTRERPFTVLLGREGTGKSVHLRRLLGQLARQALASADPGGRIPVLIDLAAHRDQPPHALDLMELMRTALTRHWPGLEPGELHRRWHEDPGSGFRVVVDNLNALSLDERVRLVSELARASHLATGPQGPRHRFLIACDRGCLELGLRPGGLAELLPVGEYLVVRRLGFPRVEGYLTGLGDPAADALARALRERRLFDLAGLPWLLFHLLARARLGETPVSRTAVIRGFVDRTLAEVDADPLVRGRTRASLGALGRALQLGRRRSLGLDRTLEILDDVRGRREYRLTEMLDALVRARLLMRIGQERVQFAYPELQSYCAADSLIADPDRHALLDDITATLGRLSRLRWWADTLVLMAGLAEHQTELIEPILHGAGAGQEERVFLAARCIEEGGTERLDPLLLEQLSAALLHLANADYEPRTRVRIRAIHAIQRLQMEGSVPHLVRIALLPVRTDWTGRQVAEYSSVRLAAITSLRAMERATFSHVKAEVPELATLLRYWIAARAADVEDYLGASDKRMRPVAAFLLGLMPSRDAHDRLITQFHAPIHEPEVTWALTDALTLVDPARVSTEVLAPLVAVGGQTRRQRRQLAYLIGKVKPREPWAARFLERAVHELTDASLKGHALRAWGDLLASDKKDLLTRIALGDFGDVAVGKSWRPDDRLWLRRVAIETLAVLGDADTVGRLRRARLPGQDWPPDLELALFRTGEEIAWRTWESQEESRAADPARRPAALTPARP